jgi:hypothetical protein
MRFEAFMSLKIQSGVFWNVKHIVCYKVTNILKQQTATIFSYTEDIDSPSSKMLTLYQTTWHHIPANNSLDKTS